MNNEASRNQGKDYEIPCQLLPATQFDLSDGIAPEKLAKVPVGGLVRDELVHEPLEFDFSEEADVCTGHRILLRQGQKLLGPPDPAMKSALTAIKDVERLERLSEAILTVKSWQELLSTP